VIKISGFLWLLLVLVLPSGAQDFLDGGYVSSGNTGDMGQYFTDPIFRSPSGSYISLDQAVRGMQESLDRPYRIYRIDRYQRLLGRGSITLGGLTKGALASGHLSGSKITADLVPKSGTELYSIL
jgi:hypothetical protein